MPELTWKGKLDEGGKRTPVGKMVLSFQVLETVGPLGDETDEAQGGSFSKPGGDSPWRNAIIWGDNKTVMSSLIPQFAGKFNLIYIDPPFATGQSFSLRVRVGHEASGRRAATIKEEAYRDTWGGELDVYLQTLFEQLILMKELLADEGSIYVHVGPGVAHYVRAILDEVFGADCFRNEIVWRRDIAGKGAKRISGQWPRNADHILFYSRSPERWFFQQAYRELSEHQKRVYRYREPDGRPFKTVQLGDYSEESIRRMEREGLIYVSSTGKKYKKYYLDEARDTVDCIWTDILGFGTRTAAAEHLAFPTQKPEALLRRILQASSRPGDLVGDFFCGSGTTGAVAERLNRRWILCDMSRHAIHVTRKRLLEAGTASPFQLLTLRDYARHKLAAKGCSAADRYRSFILQLYGAKVAKSFRLLHGKKSGAYVHVGDPGAPVTTKEIVETLTEAREGSISAVHFLGWEFEAGLGEQAGSIQREQGVRIRLVLIPRKCLEMADPTKEKVRFFRLNRCSVSQKVKGRTVTVVVVDFSLGGAEYLPKEARQTMRQFSDCIDYWAVDWDSSNGSFHSLWQAFRTRKKPKLPLKATHTFASPGTYRVAVRIVDIFTNEAATVLTVRVE